MDTISRSPTSSLIALVLLVVGCARTETYVARLRVPLANNPAGEAAARACVQRCRARADTYRVAMCMRGCPGVDEREGYCTAKADDQPPQAACVTWRTDKRVTDEATAEAVAPFVAPLAMAPMALPFAAFGVDVTAVDLYDSSETDPVDASGDTRKPAHRPASPKPAKPAHRPAKAKPR